MSDSFLQGMNVVIFVSSVWCLVLVEKKHNILELGGILELPSQVIF